MLAGGGVSFGTAAALGRDAVFLVIWAGALRTGALGGGKACGAGGAGCGGAASGTGGGGGI